MEDAERRRIGEQIAREHREVESTMHEVEVVVSHALQPKPHPDKIRELRDRLRDFGHHLQRHFELEETGGFLEGVDVSQPSMKEKVELLRREHRELVDKVYWLVQELNHFLETGEIAVSALQEQVTKLFSVLRAHEAVEEELLQESFYRELGTGD
jgi:hemerythrin-like domain-containing protein